MKLKFSILYFTFLFAMACSKENTNDDSNDSSLNLSNLDAGQTARYIAFESECGSPQKFKYTGDTIIVSIAKQNDQLIWEERYTAHSPQKSGGTFGNIKVSKNNMGLSIPDHFGSMLFNFYGSDTLKLNMKTKVPVRQNGCFIELGKDVFRGGEVATVPSFRHGTFQVENKTVVSCIPTIEVNGYIFYDDQSIDAVYAHYKSSFNGFTSDFIRGWKRINIKK